MLTSATAGGVATLTLSRPPVNALDLGLTERLAEAVAGVAVEPAARVVLIESELPVFCGGADIGMIRGYLEADGGPARLVSFAARLQEVLGELERLSQPTIAAVSGAATGGGLELALACDLRVVAEDARVGLPEISIGLLPGGGGTERLTRIAGEATALRLMLDGELVDGVEAHRLGIAQHRAGDAAATRSSARALAARLAARPPAALAAIKRCIRLAGTADSYAASLHASRELASAPEARQLAAAFFER